MTGNWSLPDGTKNPRSFGTGSVNGVFLRDDADSKVSDTNPAVVEAQHEYLFEQFDRLP